MIYRLQKKFIIASALAVCLVMLFIFILINSINAYSITKTLDTLADEISTGGGRFSEDFGEPPKHEIPSKKPSFEFINPETRFSTRHFTVWLDENGNLVKANTEFIFSVSEEQALEYAKAAISEHDERGWMEGYRYKTFTTKEGILVAFVDARANLASLFRNALISGAVLLLAGMVVILLIIVFSKKAVKPSALAYEKQKQFVTDANHELKTPLTLILANLDIAESELGKSEWLDDMRSEGERMKALVEELVVLSRFDEEKETLDICRFDLSDAICDTVSEFSLLAEERNLVLSSDIEQGASINADEALIRRLVAILLDNAVKYCDFGGEIKVTLKKKRGVVFTVENTYSDVDKLMLERLFDRFYRADKARSFTGGFGIGLSIAKTIAEKHKFKLSAYKSDVNTICFKIIF